MKRDTVICKIGLTHFLFDGGEHPFQAGHTLLQHGDLASYELEGGRRRGEGKTNTVSLVHYTGAQEH